MPSVTGTPVPGASSRALGPSARPLSAASEGLWSSAGDLLPCLTAASPRQTPRLHWGLYKWHFMSMVRQLSSAWKEEELLATFKKHRSTFSPAEIIECFYSNDNVFLPCQNGNFQEVYSSQEKKYAPSLVLALLRLWPLYCVFNLPNLSTCPDKMTRSKGIFSADYLDLCPFHCSPVPPSPYSLLSQIPLNHPGAALSFRELQARPWPSAV